jgi:hypothetical protein
MTITVFDFNTSKAKVIQEVAPSFPTPAPTKEEQEAARREAYILEADPLAMKMLRDAATKEEWLAKIAEIKARYPDPTGA